MYALIEILLFNCYLIYILSMLHHASYYITSFNTVCINDFLYENGTENSPVYIIMCVAFSWAILNKYIILLCLSSIPACKEIAEPWVWITTDEGRHPGRICIVKFTQYVFAAR